MSRKSVKIEKLTAGTRKVLDALVNSWLEGSEMGRHLLLAHSKDEARRLLYELKDHGLVQFSYTPGGPFSIMPVIPRHMREQMQ